MKTQYKQLPKVGVSKDPEFPQDDEDDIFFDFD